MHYRLKNTNGFALADIVIISLITLIILSSLLTIASNAFQGVYKDHYQTMAEEAAEAGTAYATSCLWQSSKVQTWGSNKGRPDLTPSTDCNGTEEYSSTNKYVYTGDRVRTRFTVPDLDFATDYSVQISSIGYAEILNSNGSVKKTYTSILKKAITWEADLEASQSASGTNRTCAILSGKVYCWGYGAYGQLGNGKYKGGSGDVNIGSGGKKDIEKAHDEYDSDIPVKVKQEPGVLAGKTVKKIFTAQHHSCALTTEGKVYCWGFNKYGQLGTNNTTDSPVPVEVKGLLAGKIVSDIGGTGNTSCAITSGEIYCWGQNNRGTVGNGRLDGQNVLLPSKLSISGTATKLATDGTRSFTMCAIIDNKAWCWGNNRAGSVGNGRTGGNIYSPTRVVEDYGILRGKNITDISQDGYSWSTDDSCKSGEHVCAVAGGKVYCWGCNNEGQIGDRSIISRNRPVAVNTSGVLRNKVISEVRVGVHHSCALSGDDIYCWGQGSNGQLGYGGTTGKVSPVAVLKEPGKLYGATIKHIGGGANRGCATTGDGRTFCWGRNTEGQIGDGTHYNRPTPTEALFLRPIANQYIY